MGANLMPEVTASVDVTDRLALTPVTDMLRHPGFHFVLMANSCWYSYPYWEGRRGSSREIS